MVTMTRRTSRRRGQRGFTLIELIVVVTIIGILAGIAVVHVRNAQRKAMDTALRADLHEMRKAIDDFYADKQRYPSDLNELTPHYLRKIPNDPITKQADWDQISDTPDADQQADPSADATKGPGIIDVKSKAPGKTLDGTPYSDL
jgi:general secretion pathway protein G